MKTIALLILALGIGISASFGARITPEIREQMVLEGQLKFLQETTSAAHGAYCEARGEAELEAADGCGDHELAEPEVAEGASEADVVAAWTAHLATLREGTASTDGALLELRNTWLTALEAQVAPAAAVSVLIPPDPAGRVTSWFNSAGLMFLFGLALIFVGAILGRKATKEEALSELSEGAEQGPRDFGEMLGELVDAIGALADEAKEALIQRMRSSRA